jgi:NTE family protein
MSGPSGVIPTGLWEGSRWHAARVARREIAALRAQGIPVVAFHPDREVQEAMGDDFMCRDRVEDIVQQAFLATGRHAAMPRVRDALEPLRRSSRAA